MRGVRVRSVQQGKADLERALELAHVYDLPIRDYPVNLTSAESISSGIIAAANDGCDLIVVTRGGADRRVLRPFDNPDLAATVASVAATVPVIMAIGHVGDRVAAAEFASYPVWDTATPTAAGSCVARIQREFIYGQVEKAPDGARFRSDKNRAAAEEIHAKRERKLKWIKVAAGVGFFLFLVTLGLTC